MKTLLKSQPTRLPFAPPTFTQPTFAPLPVTVALLTAILLGGCGDDEAPCQDGTRRACEEMGCFGFQSCSAGTWGSCDIELCAGGDGSLPDTSVGDGGFSDAGVDAPILTDADPDPDAGMDASTPPSTGLSPHTIDVGTWDCEASDAVIIDSVDDFRAINNSDIRVFCVRPGDYRGAGEINITASGSEATPRILALYDGERTHPIDLETAEQAVLQNFWFDGGDWWILDRLTFQMEGSSRGNWLRNGATHNVVNMMVANNYQNTAFGVTNGSHANTLQNSVIRNGPRGVGDRVAAILAAEYRSSTTIHDSMFLNNEIYDGTDAIQLMLSDLALSQTDIVSDFAGTIIDNNDLYATPDSQIPCHDNSGTCSWYENGLDIKAGSLDPGRPVEVVNNRIWGWRRTNSERSNGSSSWGSAVVIHQSAAYVNMRDNIVFASSRGISLLPVLGAGRNTISDNYVADIDSGADGHGFGFVLYDGERTEAYRNTVVRANKWLSTNEGTNDIRCNVVIDSNGGAAGNARGDYNFFYDARPHVSGTNNIIEGSASAARMEPLCFRRQIWTNPSEHCIEGLRSTAASPHADACDPSLGSVSGFGVDDVAYGPPPAR